MKSLEVLRRFEDQKPQEPKIETVDLRTRLKLCEALTSSGEFGIPWRSWGKLPGTKRLGTLLKEAREGESTFTRTINIRTKEVKLIRKVSKAIFNVIHVDSDGNEFGLYEEILTPNGWVRRREDPISQNGVKGKVKLNETALDTAIRGLQEEMGIKDLSGVELKDLVFIGSRVELLESSGYPGLDTDYTFSDFQFKLPLRFYKPEYYFSEGRRRMRLLWEKVEWQHLEDV